MPRRREVPKREVLPDPKFGSTQITKFVNMIMVSGKKSVAETIMYNALDRIGGTPIQYGADGKFVQLADIASVSKGITDPPLKRRRRVVRGALSPMQPTMGWARPLRAVPACTNPSCSMSCCTSSSSHKLAEYSMVM